MDFDLRTWLAILGPLFVVGVLLHGFWRMKNNRSNLKMSLDKSFLNEEARGDDLLMFKAELPNGGARVLSEQTDLDLDDDVPVLMDPVKIPAASKKPVKQPEPEGVNEAIQSDYARSVASGGDTLSASRDQHSAQRIVESASAISAHESPATKEPSLEKPDKQGNYVLDKALGPEKFVVVSVLSTAETFPGEALLLLLSEQKMVHGEMEIFHRQDRRGESIFSLANAVEPGTFDPATFKHQSTPGISLFLRVHELADPVQAFNDMVDVAQVLAEVLGGELRDETRSVMTSQTIAHAQQDLIQYQHKYR